MPDKKTPYTNLPTFDRKSGDLNVVIETPKGSRNKFTYDHDRGLFKLGGVLPAGAVFPYDFGFVPDTIGGDGDPLDVLVLMDQSAFAGCLVPSRLIGVIEAEQTEDGETMRNDRLIAVAADSHDHKDVLSLSQVSESLMTEIEHFFKSYNELKGKKFEPKARSGPKRARKLVEKGIAQARKPARASTRSKMGKRSGKKANTRHA